MRIPISHWSGSWRTGRHQLAKRCYHRVCANRSSFSWYSITETLEISSSSHDLISRKAGLEVLETTFFWRQLRRWTGFRITQARCRLQLYASLMKKSHAEAGQIQDE